MNIEKNYPLLLLIAFIITIVIIRLTTIIVYKKLNKRNKKLLQTTPINVKFYDILVYSIRTNNGIKRCLIPILKNTTSNEYYIPKYDDVSIYMRNNFYEYFFHNSKEISDYSALYSGMVDFEKEGKIYINKITKQLTIEGQMIKYGLRKMKYAGKIVKEAELGNIYSVKNDNILNEISNAKKFTGIVDFEIKKETNK